MSPEPLRVGILTISDRCARGQATDTSGPALADWVRRRLGAATLIADCVPDEVESIGARLRQWAGGNDAPELILTTGGTGLSPRDVTPEATLAVLERRHAGLLELARLRCLEHTPLTYLSRGEAGTIGRTLVINLPGSPRGAVQMADALADVLPHALGTLRGRIRTHEAPAGPPTAPPLVLLLVLCALVLSYFGGARAVADEITVAAAISMEQPLLEAARRFEADTGHRVRFSFGSSGQLLAQIGAGAQIDVYISAGQQQMDRLLAEGLGDRSTCRTIATNSLVLIVPREPAGDIDGFGDLRPPLVRRLSIGEPRTVPAGLYAQQVLQRLGLLDALADRIVYGASVRQVLDYVARGEVSAGLVYATEAARASDRVRVVAIAPPQTHDPIRYPAAVVTDSGHRAAGVAFIAFLVSPQGQARLKAAGFGLPEAPTTIPTTAPGE